MIKDSVEFLEWNEEKVLPYELKIILFAWCNHVDEISNQSFLIHKSSE
jgi:hypothetical protein